MLFYVAAMNKNILYCVEPESMEKVSEKRLFCQGAHTIKIDHNSQYIYTADSYDKTLSLLDIITGERKSIGVGSSPNHMEICKKNGLIYVSNYDSDSISVICQKEMTPVLTIKTGSMPHHICLSRDEKILYVSQMGSNIISQIDTGSNQIVGETKLNTTPMHMRIGQITDRLYVACTDFEGDKGGEILTIEGDLVKRFQVGKYLSDLCVLEAEAMVYAVDGQRNRLYAFDMSQKSIVEDLETGEFPDAIDYDSDSDRILVSTHIQNEIEAYERATLKYIHAFKVGGDFGHIAL